MKKQYRSTFLTRQYMLSDDFEIFYYSDTHFNTVPMHSHDYYEFYVFVEGDVRFKIGKNIYPIKLGTLFIIPPGTNHQVIVNPNKTYSRFVFWISKEYCNSLLQQSVDYVYLIQKAATQKKYNYQLDLADFHTIQAKLFLLLEEIHSDRFGKSIAISNSINDLLIYLNRTIYEEEHEEKESNLFQNLTSYIEQNLHTDLSLEELSERFFLNKYYLAHYFKDHLGISLHQYILKKRLNACRNALIGEEKITEIFLDYGFKDYSSFYRAFKKEFSLSPKEFQKMYQKNAHTD